MGGPFTYVAKNGFGADVGDGQTTTITASPDQLDDNETHIYLGKIRDLPDTSLAASFKSWDLSKYKNKDEAIEHFNANKSYFTFKATPENFKDKITGYDESVQQVLQSNKGLNHFVTLLKSENPKVTMHVDGGKAELVSFESAVKLSRAGKDVDVVLYHGNESVRVPFPEVSQMHYGLRSTRGESTGPAISVEDAAKAKAAAKSGNKVSMGITGGETPELHSGGLSAQVASTGPKTHTHTV